MRKNIIILALISVCLFMATALDAQDVKKQKNAAKSFLNATPSIIKNAIAQKKKSKIDDEGSGPLIAKAFDHHKHAVDLYNAVKYEKAIYHALKARKYAILSIKERKGDYNETADPEIIFKDFKDPKDKENKAYYKNLKKVLKNVKDVALGDLEGELDSGIEVTEDDAKVDPKQLIMVK